jgi:tRNA threonylcarbamoyladenosine biosynthesis protein TsaE
MEVLSTSPRATKELARGIAQKIKPGSVLFLYGDLGAGKTTFVQGFIDGLGFGSRVQSPTFILMRTYQPLKETKVGSGVTHVNHLDLYRLTDPSEFDSLDIWKNIEDKNAVTIIEWPKVIENMIPNSIKVYIEVAGENERKINVQNLH